MAERDFYLSGPSGSQAKTHATAGELLPKNLALGSQGNFQRVVEWERLGFMG